MAFEGMRKWKRDTDKQAENAAVKDPLSGEALGLGEHDRTQPQIWQDDALHAKFVRFLSSKDKRRSTPIIKALTEEGLLTESQQEYVANSVKEFNARSAEMARLDKAFTHDYVRNLGDADKSIGLMIKQIGVEKAHELLRRQFEDLSLEDEKAFKKIVKGMSDEHALAQSAWVKSVETRVAHALDQIGVRSDLLGGYVSKSLAMTSGFDASEKDSLMRAAQENMGKIMTIIDVVRGNAISRRRAENFADAFEKQRDALKQSNVHLADVAKALKATLTQEMKLEVQRVAIEGGDLKAVPETTVNTIGDYKAVREEAEKEHTEAAREKRLEELIVKRYQKKPKNQRNLASLTPTEKDEIREEFVEGEMEMQRKHRPRGIFVALVSLLFKSKTDLQAEVLRKLP